MLNNSKKRSGTQLPLHTKAMLLRQLEAKRITRYEICQKYSVKQSTISIWLMNKDKIMKFEGI